MDKLIIMMIKSNKIFQVKVKIYLRNKIKKENHFLQENYLIQITISTQSNQS